MEAAAGGGAPPGELWRHTAPYRGLCAMTESDAGLFFGRENEYQEVIDALGADKLAVLLGNSGVGKSSLAQAGVIAGLMEHSRDWRFLKLKPGVEPARALVESFLWNWPFDEVDPRWAIESWVSDLVHGTVTLSDLLDATEARLCGELHQPEPLAFLIYIDQGEELYVRAEERARARFWKILEQGLGPRLRVMMSMGADFSAICRRTRYSCRVIALST